MDCIRLVSFVVLSISLLLGVTCQPDRPAIPDDPEARRLFHTAEANRTPDGFLTTVEMEDIFSNFDNNSDGRISQTEFMNHWNDLHLGDTAHASRLFHRADTDRDGSISRVPDYSRLFYYFDRDGDGKISEDEFTLVWFSLST